MTLGDGKRKVLMLLDEYSTAGVVEADADIMLKMNDFFDMAQKDVAQWQPIIRRVALAPDGSGAQELPADVASVLRVREGSVEIVGRTVYYDAGRTEDITLECIMTPETITPNTLDSNDFEVSEEAANCLPYYVAAQQLITDLVVDYGSLWQLYQQEKSQLDRSGSSSGGGRVRQALFRG